MFSRKIKTANDNLKSVSAKSLRVHEDPSLIISAFLGVAFALMLFGLIEAVEMFTALILQAITR